MKTRKHKGEFKITCSGCDKELEQHRKGKYRYCLECHAKSGKKYRNKKKKSTIMITVGELKKILKKLPNSMPVVLGVETSLENICAANVEVVKVEFTDVKDEYENLLVLPVCKCEEEDFEVFNEIVDPELN